MLSVIVELTNELFENVLTLTNDATVLINVCGWLTCSMISNAHTTSYLCPAANRLSAVVCEYTRLDDVKDGSSEACDFATAILAPDASIPCT